MNFTEKVFCPSCACNEAKTVRQSQDIVECEGCGLVYLRTRPPVHELEAHYQRYASNPGSHMALPKTVAEIKNTPLRRNHIMSAVISLTGAERRRMIDVGSGWGAFLVNGRDHGFQVNGVEICKEMADFATNTLGIKTHACQLEAVELPNDCIQVVTLLHSMEHLPHLSTALEYIHRILEPDGLLCGIVPNFDSWGSNNMREKWPWLDPEMHYQHWTPTTLKGTLWLYGFNTLSMHTATGDFDKKFLPVGKMLEQIEADGHGEEIRFFSQKI